MRLDAAAFELDGKPVSWGDVLARAVAGGRLDDTLVEIEDLLGRERAAEREGIELDQAAVKNAVNEWRSTRNQASSDETRRWLEVRGLELGDLVGFVRRNELKRILGDRALPPAERIEAFPLLRLHIAFSGRDEALALEIANESVVERPTDKKKLDAMRDRMAAALSRSAKLDRIAAAIGISTDVLVHGIDHAASYRLARDRIVSSEAMNEQLARDQRAMTRIEFVTATFDAESVALEMRACLSEQKKWLEPLAGEMGFETARQVSLVEDLPPGPISSQLAVGKAGDVIGPVEQDGAFLLYEVLSRVDPDLRDGGVRARIETRVLHRALQLEVQRRVRIRAIDA